MSEGEFKKRLRERFSKTYPFYEEAIKAWVDEAAKDFPHRYLEELKDIWEANTWWQPIDEWFRKWFGSATTQKPSKEKE